MSTIRANDDSWDISSGVGVTALMGAFARAVESDRAGPVLRDPYARALVKAATGPWTAMLDESVVAQMKAASPETAAIIDHLINHQVVRAQFFDARIVDAVADGIRQVVILASGLDSRAYRLDWPAGTVVYEVDQPKVLEYKTSTLAAQGVVSSIDHRLVPVDLRQDWPAALRGKGFESTVPTAWLAEGLLAYLTADAQDGLLAQLTGLSPPGSRLAIETAAKRDRNRRESMWGPSERMFSQLGFTPTEDLSNLAYPGQDRAMVADWLNEHGWQATAQYAPDEMRRLNRWVDGIPMADDRDAFAEFVTAQRQ